MRDSTKMMAKKHGWRVDRFVHNYIYFIFYYPYVRTAYHSFRIASKYLSWFKPLNPMIGAILARYHSKVLSYGDTEKFFTINEDLRAITDQNKEIVPFKYAHKIIFQEPEHLAVMDCPCKKTLKDEDWAINSCIAIGKGLSSFWLDHGEKYHARKITQQEAIDMVKKFRDHGYVTQSFFKVATGGSTGVVCNCHPDTCVSLQATKFSKKFSNKLTMTAEAGYAVTHDEKKCEKCGTCAEICPFDAIEVSDITWTYDKDQCYGCELCVEKCEKKALTLYNDDEKCDPLDLDLVKEKYLSA